MPMLNDIISQISTFLSHENDDITDRYHYRYTVISLAIFLLLHTSKQYYGDPIQCATLSKTHGPLNNYVHSICWTNGTYKVIVDNTTDKIKIPPMDDSTKIYYYQWTIFIIIFQCFLFTLPSVLWSFAIRLNGFDLVYVCRNVIKNAYLEYYSSNGDWSKINKTLQHVGDHLRLSLLKLKKKKAKNSFSIEKKNDDTTSSHPDTKLSHFDSCFVSGFNRFGSFSPNKQKEPRLKSKPAFPLYWSYLLVKLMYIGNIVIQYLFLSWLFSFNYFTYGPITISSIIRKQYNFDNNYFPKQTLCLINLFNIDEKKEHFAYLCSQPMNLLNEIFYFLFWFWLIVLFWLTASSMIFWLRLVLYKLRKQHVRSIMKDQLANLSENDEDRLYRNTGLSKNESFDFFYRDVCSLDLIFVIDLLAMNSTNIVARDILANLWDEYFEIDSVCDDSTLKRAVDYARLPLTSVRFSQRKPPQLQEHQHQQPQSIEQLSQNIINDDIGDSDDRYKRN